MNRGFLTFEDVTFGYDPDFPVLHHISFAVPQGEFVVVLGGNGSGKSTLARLCNGLLLPQRGTVTVGEHVLQAGSAPPWELRRRVGMVFQHPDNQLIGATVEEDIAFGPENLGWPPAAIRKRVDAVMEEVGIAHLRDRPPHELSGGQKQLVALAGVLVMEPDCIVFDEATSMLDPQSARTVMKVLRTLHRERGLTIVHITHRLEEAAHAQRVLVLAQGRLVADCPPACLFEQEDILTEANLEAPPLVRLIQGLRAKGWPVASGSGSFEETVNAVWQFMSAG